MKRGALAKETILTKGWNALLRALGPAGATRFLLAVEHGHGDLTRDIRAFRKGKPIEDA